MRDTRAACTACFQSAAEMLMQVHALLGIQAAWHRTDVQNLPMPSVVTCSALAGSGAAWLSSPLDMIKLRIQVQRRAAASVAARTLADSEGFTFAYRGMLDGVATVLREEGLAALWRGAGTRVAFMMPSSAISMVAFEWCKRHYTRLWTGTAQIPPV